MKSTPAKPVAALRKPLFQTPLPVFGVKIDPHWQYEQRFQKVLAALREKPPGIAGRWGSGGGIDPRPYSCTSFARTRSFSFVQHTICLLRENRLKAPCIRAVVSLPYVLKQIGHRGNTAFTGVNSYATERGSFSSAATSGSR